MQFLGGYHYPNSKSTSGKKVSAGPAKITHLAKNGIHQIHVIHTDSTSKVYGWVDLSDISKL